MKTRYLCFAMACLFAMVPVVNADPMQELIETLGSEYEALMPPPQRFGGHRLPRSAGRAGLSIYGAINWFGLLPKSRDAR